MKKFEFLNGLVSIRLRDGFGHGLFSVRIAKVFNLPLAICPEKNTKEDYDVAVQQTIDLASFFFAKNQKWFTVKWEEKDEVLKTSLDCVKGLQNKIFDADFWVEFASRNANLDTEITQELNDYQHLGSEKKIMVTPAKLYSDGNSGASAAQQSLPFEFFDWLKNRGEETLVLGQHFAKSTDLDKILELASRWDGLYVPGMVENEEVLGLRGVPHSKLYNLYNKLDGCIGIPGTHTWYLLTTFPNVPQVIVYNRAIVEDWDEIASAFQTNGYPIFAIGFDENTNMQKLQDEVHSYYNVVL